MTGYEAAIMETGRLTDMRIELEEDARNALDLKQRILIDIIDELPEIAVTYFKPDERNAGGVYVTVIGDLKKIDDYERVLVLMSGERIQIADILDIDCELFEGMI